MHFLCNYLGLKYVKFHGTPCINIFIFTSQDTEGENISNNEPRTYFPKKLNDFNKFPVSFSME